VLAHSDRSVVLDVSNQSNDYSYNLTGGIQRQFYNNFAGSLFYTYTKAVDAQSLTSSTASSQYTYGRDWAGNESDPTATRSDFEQKHHLVAQGTYSFPTRTDVTFTYQGGSGQPIDYVYSGDLNGDGYSNDPIYIPKDATNSSEIQFANLTSNGVTYTPAQQAAALNSFIQSQPCLNSERGQIMTRNACTTPWTNLVNLAVRQSFGAGQFHNITLEVQVYNFLNLVNSNWGHQQYVGFSGSQTLLTEKSIAGGNLTNGVPVVTFNPNFATWNPNNLASNYQLQFQVRYAF
jgi:hypothetical protein